MIVLVIGTLLQLGTMGPGQVRSFPTFDPTRRVDDTVEMVARGPDDGTATCALGVDFVRDANGDDVSPIVIAERTLAFCFVPEPGRSYTALPFDSDGLDGGFADKSFEMTWLRATRVGTTRGAAVREPAPEPPLARAIFTPRRPGRIRMFQGATPGRLIVTPAGGHVRVVHVRPVDRHHWRVVTVDTATPDAPFRSAPCPDTHAFFVVEPEAGTSYEVRAEAGAPADVERWRVIATDDGETDSHWGQIGSSTERAVKRLTVPRGPWREARVAYRTAAAPYHSDTKRYATGAPAPPAGWGTLELIVNGERALSRPLPDAALPGWHVVPVDPARLREGENEIAFSVSGTGMIYLAIDLDTDASASYSETSGRRSTSLRPARPVGPGEYLIRLWVR